MVVDRLSLAELEVGRVRPGSPAVRRLRILSIPWGLTVWGVVVGVDPEQGGGGDGDTGGGSQESGDGPGEVLVTWLSMAAAFMSVMLCSADSGPAA